MDIEKELLSLKQSHYECDDGWYSCPLSSEGTFNEFKEQGKCDCGAAEHNAKVDAIIGELRRLRVLESPATDLQQLHGAEPTEICPRCLGCGNDPDCKGIGDCSKCGGSGKLHHA